MLWCSDHQRTNGVSKRWREMPRWLYASSMTEGSVPHVGCHGDGLTSIIVPFSYFFDSRFGCRSSGSTEEIEIYRHHADSLFVPVAVETIRLVKAEGIVFWNKLVATVTVTGDPRETFFLFLSICPRSTIQRDRFSWRFHFRNGHWSLPTPDCFIFSF